MVIRSNNAKPYYPIVISPLSSLTSLELTSARTDHCGYVRQYGKARAKTQSFGAFLR